MPYFVYKISPPLTLTHIATKDSYREARTLVRGLRLDQPQDEGTQFRMVFAGTRAEAEKLLSRPKDERVIGED
jgi:hypothetical protein